MKSSQKFEVVHIAFYLDLVSFIEEDRIFYLVINQQIGRSYGVYGGGVREFVSFRENSIYPIKGFVHSVQVERICTQSLDFPGYACFLRRFATTAQTDDYKD